MMKATLALLFAFIALCSALEGHYTEDKYESTLYACRDSEDANKVYGTYSALGNLGSFIATSTDDGESFQGTWIEKNGDVTVASGRLNFTSVGSNYEGWYDECTLEDCLEFPTYEWNAVRTAGFSSGSPFCMRPQSDDLANSLVGSWVGGAGFTSLYLCRDAENPSIIYGSAIENDEFFMGYTTEEEDGQTARGTKYFSLERDVSSDDLWNSLRTGVWFFRQLADNNNVIYGQESVCTKNEEGTRCSDPDEGRWVTYRRAAGTSLEQGNPWAQCNSRSALQDSSASAMVASAILIVASLFVTLF